MRLTVPLLVALAALALVAGIGPARGAQKVVDHDFIGADRCRSCHAEEFEAWAKTPHARAFEVLSARDRTDPRCLSCHTTVPDDLSANLVGIQCESCHGPGRWYSVDYVMRDEELRATLQLAKVDATTCTRCHTDTSPALVPFVFSEKLPLIKHWKDRPGEKPAGANLDTGGR
jgi:hypothetical protein